MNDTCKLLEEVDSGCKMAINSMNRITSYKMDEKLAHLIDSYKYKHMELEKQAAELLRANGRPEKEPGMMAATMSNITTNG